MRSPMMAPITTMSTVPRKIDIDKGKNKYDLIENSAKIWQGDYLSSFVLH